MRIAPRRQHTFVAALLIAITPVLAAHAGEHPALLLSHADLPRLRHACGVAQPHGPAADCGRSGVRAADFQTLRAYFAIRLGTDVLPGELPALAFLHLVDPHDPADAARVQIIERVLSQPAAVATDPLETILALDWCWNELAPPARHEFLLASRARAEVLTPADSPLDSRRFRERLATLALALVVDETDEPAPSWLMLRERILAAARAYFTTTFPAYVAWRGLSPTGSANASREECDTAIAIELGAHVLGRDLWQDYRDTVGRWLEHYVFGTLDHPALAHDFLHDDGNAAPLSPAAEWGDFLPLTAHLIAARTRDPSATLLADRVEHTLADPAADGLPVLWRWVPIVFDTADIPRCDPRRLPTARNLGGAVILRSGNGPETTAVWIDAAQPFLRRRQHFDAGHFLIQRGGQLAVSGGDDVLLEAIPSKGGSQHLGDQREPFDFEQYFTATIAHNALVVWDPLRITNWYQTRYLPTGGQRPIEDTCTDFATPLDGQGRQTGRQLAYGQSAAGGSAAYLALDLAPAYDNRALTGYTREFVFFWGRALVVIDRVSLPKGRLVPTWILNLPARPDADGADLRDDARVAGSTNVAGVWRYDRATWLHWTDRDGGLWLLAATPAPKCLRVVGGPARKLLVKEGRNAERSYIGGDPDGFERLIIPAERHGARNAWYRLGQPTLLGPEFGRTPHWGRIEIEPLEPAQTVTFVTVLITDRADAREAPTAKFQRTEDALVLELQAAGDRATLRVPADTQTGGTLDVSGPTSCTWPLPTTVAPDAPLAVSPSSSQGDGRGEGVPPR